MKNIIIAITGASGAIYGIRALQLLRKIDDVTTHLIISDAGKITIAHETSYQLDEVIKLADYHHNYRDISACLSSGSYKIDAMIIAPCSVKTLAEISHGIGGNLISRSADVTLKERRKLILMVRETPLSSIHLANMLKLSDMGAFICPPVPAFYSKFETITEMVDYNMGRIFDILDIDIDINRWQGMNIKNKDKQDHKKEKLAKALKENLLRRKNSNKSDKK